MIVSGAYEEQIAGIACELGVPSRYLQRPIFREAHALISIGRDIHGRELKLAPEAAENWRKLQSAAAMEGVELLSVSGYRSVAQQRQIIERKLAAGQTIEQILKVNTAPGYSEHHTGRAIDITTPGCPPLTEQFESTPAFAWLTQRAREFRFAMTYPRNNPHGIDYEPWHWTHLTEPGGRQSTATEDIRR